MKTHRPLAGGDGAEEVTASLQIGERSAALLDVLLREELRAERDVLLDLFAAEDLHRRLHRLGAAGRVLERRIEDALLHVGDALLRKRVDADELHPLLA